MSSPPGLVYDFLYQRLVQTVSQDYPEATVLIQDVSFLCESVSGLMMNIPPPLELDDDDDSLSSMPPLESVN